jgi:histone acetyltransferase (RNA polymerase elongator complex component)
MKLSMEKGPIRPPSEAQSLLIRATRNCPWNRCAFCHTYQGCRFELRSVGEIRDDIKKAKDIADQIYNLSRQEGSGGRVTQPVVELLLAQGEFSEESIQSVAAWLHYGGESVFLQDANSLIMKTDDLVQAISSIRETFPSVHRITSYCRSRTAAGKSVEELRRLHDAGLTRIHMGVESGYDPLLRFMNKGATAADHVEGGRRLKEAGFSLCVYVMPGLGGTRWSREHAEETARVINLINPDHVRLRTLHVVAGSSLYTMMLSGAFHPLTEEGIVREIGIFIEHLYGIETTIMSDHVLNLLEEVTGKLPGDKSGLLATIGRFLAMSPEERLIFRVGRRKGIYRKLDDLAERGTFLWLKSIVDQYASDPDLLEQELKRIMQAFI